MHLLFIPKYFTPEEKEFAPFITLLSSRVLFQKETIRSFSFGKHILWHLFFPYYFFWTLWQSARLLLKRLARKYDGIIFLRKEEKIFLSGIASLLGFRVYWIVFTPFGGNGIYKWLYEKSAHRANVIAASEALLENEKTLLNFLPKSKYVLRPFFQNKKEEENIFQSFSYAKYIHAYQKHFIVGVVSSFHEHIGLEHIFHVVRLILEQLPLLQVVVIGAEKERVKLSWLAKKMEIDRHVNIVGPQQEIENWIDGFTVFMYPKKNPSWYSNELMSAMRMGKPIIAQKSLYTEELLKNTKEALLLDIENREMVAQAIVNLANNPDWLKQLSENVHAKARELFSQEKFEGQIAKIFKQKSL